MGISIDDRHHPLHLVDVALDRGVDHPPVEAHQRGELQGKALVDLAELVFEIRIRLRPQQQVADVGARAASGNGRRLPVVDHQVRGTIFAEVAAALQLGQQHGGVFPLQEPGVDPRRLHGHRAQGPRRPGRASSDCRRDDAEAEGLVFRLAG